MSIFTLMDTTPAEPNPVQDRIVVTFTRYTRDVFCAQIEAFCKESALRYRFQEERGSSASLFVIHLRGDPEAIKQLKARVLHLASTELLFIPQRRPLPRGVVSAISFSIGLLIVLGLFYLAS